LRQCPPLAFFCQSSAAESQRPKADAGRFENFPAVPEWSDFDDRQGDSIRVYDAAGNVIATYERKGDFKEP
jgi:hypothetical protein